MTHVFTDFLLVTKMFLASNAKTISKIHKTHRKNFHYLFFENYYESLVTYHDADKVIFNFSSHI